MSSAHLKKPSPKVTTFEFRRIRDLRNGDVIIIAGTNYTEHERQSISEHLHGMLQPGEKILLLFVKKFSDVKRLDKEQLRRILGDD